LRRYNFGHFGHLYQQRQMHRPSARFLQRTSHTWRDTSGWIAYEQVVGARLGFAITAEHVEVQSGKGSDALNRRPKLAAAIKAARKARGPGDA
jgi:hypothetical protein